MKFLITTVNSSPIPPEMAPGLVDAMIGWVAQGRETGKMEQVWSFAGLAGGGGIMNVDTLEELDALMAAFPFGPYSEVKVYPLADLDVALQTFKENIQQAMAAVGG